MQTATPIPTSYSLFNAWNNPAEWNLANVIALAALVVSIAALLATLLPLTGNLFNWFWQRRNKKILAKFVRSNSYSQQTIENATRYYIRALCSSIDPAQEAEIKSVVATTEDLFSFINRFLDGKVVAGQSERASLRHLIVLADSGMGKTAFVLNYYTYNARRRLSKRKRLAIVPLGSPDALGEVSKIEDQENTDLILDALDEDTKAVGAPDAYRTRLIEIFEHCKNFNHVIITCRTQFFPREDEIPKTVAGIIDYGPRSAGQTGHYQLRKVYLHPLTDDQVTAYLKNRYPGWRKRAVRRRAEATVQRIPLLTARPMLLSYIPDLLESKREIDHTYQLYEVMVEKWLKREQKWIPATDKLLAFSEEMAVDIYTNKDNRESEIIPRNKLLAIAKEGGIGLADWTITGRSLLNRDSQGNLKFAHRSIMEYLFIKKYLTTDRPARFRVTAWTDLMKMFLVEQMGIKRVYPNASSAVHYFKTTRSIDWADLRTFDFQSYLRKRFGIKDTDAMRIQFRAGKYDYVAFEEAIFPVADFDDQQLNWINFRGCRAQDFSFVNSELSEINFRDTFIQYYFSLEGARIQGTFYLERARLGSVIATHTNLSNVIGLNRENISDALVDEKTVVPN